MCSDRVVRQFGLYDSTVCTTVQWLNCTRNLDYVSKLLKQEKRHGKHIHLKKKLSFWAKVSVRVRILANRTPKNAHVRVRVRLEFWQNAHVRAMCVRPKIECANVRACEAKNRRNSQIENYNNKNNFIKTRWKTEMENHVKYFQ